MTPVSCKEINLKIYSGSGVLSVFHRMHTFYRRNVLYCFIFLCLCIVSHILWLWISSIECHVCDLIFFLKVNKIKKLHETAFFVSFPSLKECSTWLKELVNTKRGATLSISKPGLIYQRGVGVVFEHRFSETQAEHSPAYHVWLGWEVLRNKWENTYNYLTISYYHSIHTNEV